MRRNPHGNAALTLLLWSHYKAKERHIMSRPLRSATSTQGRNMAGARALWRAPGMPDGDFGKPIIARGRRHRSSRWCRQGIQHDRRRRRHCHGPRRHALLPAQPRPHRRQRRNHGQRAPRRRPRVHLQLRQDHPRYAPGSHAPEHPHHLRVWRPHGIRRRRRRCR